jgi:DNA-binding GntR family transcriptional regulator
MNAGGGNSDEMRSAVDKAAQRISDYISAGRFVAGQRLPEMDLVEQIGVSKTVLREAFARLQQEGLIELQKYKGAKVRRLSLDQTVEILSANTVLLAWAAHEAAQAIARSPERRTAVTKCRKRLQTFEPRDQREHLEAFYDTVDAILELAGSPYLAKLIGRGFNPLVKEFLLDSIEFKPEVVDHTRTLDRVLALVEKGDAEGAFNGMRQWSKLDRAWVRPSANVE